MSGIGRNMPVAAAAIALGVLVGPATTAGVLQAAVSRPAETVFKVLREGAPFGSHTVSIRREGNRDVVDIAIDLEVRVAFVTVLRYSHRNTEIWQNGRLVRLDTATDDDGERYRVSAEATGDGLLVRTRDRSYVAPAGTMPTSYWNRAVVEHSALLNTQTGELMPVTVQRLADETLPGVDGEMTAARYRFVNGDNGAPFDVWYSQRDDRWVKLRFDARGARIDYALDGAAAGASAAH